MTNDKDNILITNIVQNFLGNPRYSSGAESRNQWEFNCPTQKCRGDHKFNLAYRADSKVFKCWKCSYSGYIYRLVEEYGSKDDLARLTLLLPRYSQASFNVFKRPEIDYSSITCDLPEGYMPISQERKSKLWEHAWKYLTGKEPGERQISLAQIDKYKIGYTESGPRKFRIIMPSLNSAGRINYYEARAYLKDAKRPYWKPDTPHVHDIIYNEYYINWDLPVYLVEGVFDSYRIPNSIPLLGKSPSPLLISKLLEHKCTVIICLDSDAFKDSVDFYKMLSSLGLNVFFIDLKGEKDLSKIYEDHGQERLNELLKNPKRIDTLFEINKILNE
jgi:hypothetical protein